VVTIDYAWGRVLLAAPADVAGQEQQKETTIDYRTVFALRPWPIDPCAP